MIKNIKLLTEKEYLNYLTRLTEINQEKNLLQKINSNKNYQAHLYLPNTCEELLITIKRNNEQIDNQIKINLLNLCLLLKNNTSKKTEQLITLLITKPNQLPSIIETSSYYQEIKNLIAKKEANTYLYNYVYNL